jgi:hypothetical protein
VDAAQRFILSTTDEPELEKQLRETIVKIPTDGVCIACHKTQAHQSHPEFEGGLFRQVSRSTSNPGIEALSVEGCVVPSGARATDSSKYTVQTCGSCHYRKYRHWRAETHSALSNMLPVAYRKDGDCRTCHPNTNAAWESATTASPVHHRQVGVACENCHGPALEHVRFNLRYISSPPLGPKLEQLARDAIRKGKPAATCIQCHIGERHQEHPSFAKK